MRPVRKTDHDGKEWMVNYSSWTIDSWGGVCKICGQHMVQFLAHKPGNKKNVTEWNDHETEEQRTACDLLRNLTQGGKV